MIKQGFLHTRATKVDYRPMNDPQLHKLITQKQPNPEAPKIDSPSKEEWTNLAVEQIILGEKEFGFLVEEDCANTVKEAMNSEEEEKWKTAMEEEIETLKKMETWTLEDLLTDLLFNGRQGLLLKDSVKNLELIIIMMAHLLQ